jgi:hypothetical protein
LLKELESGTSMIRCAAAMAFATVFLLVVDDDADLSTKEAAKLLAGSFDDVVEL